MRKINKFLCLIVFAFLLVSCRGLKSTKHSVSFAVFGDPAEHMAYQTLINAFEEANPEIEIDFRHIPDQRAYRQRLASDFASGNVVDVFLLNYRRFVRLAGADGLQPLDSYLAQSNIISNEDFFSVAIDSFKWQEQLWCIPQNISSLVVYYNKDLFDEAEIPYPSDDWHWDEFVYAAEALTFDIDTDERIDQYGAGISPNIFRLAPFIWQLDGDLVDDPINPTRLTLDSAESQIAFEKFVALQTQLGVVPNRAAESAESSQSRFLNGRLALYFNSRRMVPTLRTIDSFEWDVAPLPRITNKFVGILHSDGYCMSANATDKDAAWHFIEFANSQEGQAIIAQSGRTVPSLTSVAYSHVFLDPNLPPQNSRIYVDTISNLHTVPKILNWIKIEELSSKEVERAFYGDISTLEAATIAADITLSSFILDE